MFSSVGLLLNRSTVAPFTGQREIAALLRGPMPSPSLFLGTQDTLRLAKWHRAAVKDQPQVIDAQISAVGTQQGGQIDVELAGALPAPAYEIAAPYLTHQVYVATGSGSAYAYHRITADLNWTIPAGAFLEFEQNVDSGSVYTGTAGPGLDLEFTDATAGRDFALADQFGQAPVTFDAVARNGVGNWVARKTPLDKVAGKVLRTVTLVNEDDTAFNHTITHYRNIRITNGDGRTLLVIWANGVPTANATMYTLRNSQSSVVGPETLKHETFVRGTGNPYSYWRISTAARVIISNDYLEYEVLVPEDSGMSDGNGSMEIDFTDLSNGRTLGMVDQFGDSIVGFRPVTRGAIGNFVKRRISLAAAIGKTVLSWDLVNECGSGTAADICRFAAHYRNIVVTDNAGFVRQVVWTGGTPPANTAAYENLVFNTTVTLAGSTRQPGSAEEWLAAIMNQPVDVDLVTRHYRSDGTTSDAITEARGVVKQIARGRGVTRLKLAGIDQALMQIQFPAKLFVLTDWANLYKDHVNRAIPQGVGLGVKIPCAYVDNTPGAYKYAVCEIPTGMATPSVLVVYRGTQDGKGQVISASEYTVGSETRASGTVYLTLTFASEQINRQLGLYTIEVDVMAPGSRLPGDEIARLLPLIGGAADPADFADAAAYHAQIGVYIDAWYTTQRPAANYIDQLLMAARGWLSQSVGGMYSIFVDRPRDAQRLLYDETDQIEVTEATQPELPRTIRLRADPRVGVREYEIDLTRTTSGGTGEKIFINEFVRDVFVADALVDYLAKKEARRRVTATLVGMPLKPGELVAINSPLVLDGWKMLAALNNRRQGDANYVEFEEIAASDYSYTAGTLPADATNVYQPDYSFTPPAAPTSCSVVSNATATDATGKAFTTLLVRGTPPALNWQKLWAIVVTNSSGAQTARHELKLNAGNYEVSIGGLLPNVAHTVQFFAQNANGLDGVATNVAVTTAVYASAPPTPTIPVGALLPGRTVSLDVPIPTYAHRSHVEWQRKTGVGGLYATLDGQNGPHLEDSNGLAYGSIYYYKARYIDLSGNAGSYSPEFNVTVTPTIQDTHVLGGGINGVSIGNGAINRGRSDTSTASASGSIAPGDTASLVLDKYTFQVAVATTWSGSPTPATGLALRSDVGSIVDDTAVLQLHNDNPSRTATYDVRYRRFNS